MTSEVSDVTRMVSSLVTFLDINVTLPLPTSALPLSDAGYLTIGVYLTFLGLVALVGNSTVLLVILGQKSAIRKLQNILLVNMAAADLLVTVTAYPLTAVSSYHGRWLFGEITCQVGGFVVFMLTMVSMNTLTFIGVFRYILVCQPKYHHLLKPATARPVLLACWGHAVLWTALPLLGWNAYVPETFKTSCTIDWDSPTAGGRSYVVLTMVLCYLLHLAVVVFCYARILVTSRRLTFGARKNSSLVKLEEILWHHKVETEREVTKMCAVMIAAFIVCWTPYTIIACVAALEVPISTDVGTLPTMFAKLSCALNPIIYAFMSSKFREVLVTFGPWQQKSQNRVATAAIEIPRTKVGVRDSVPVREYRGDMTNQGIYIGNMAVALEIQSSVF